MRDAPHVDEAPVGVSRSRGGDGPLPAIAGGSAELDPPEAPSVAGHWEATLVAVLAGAATVVLGVVPQPLFDLVREVGGGLGLF
jgi:hypothetical protein